MAGLPGNRLWYPVHALQPPKYRHIELRAVPAVRKAPQGGGGSTVPLAPLTPMTLDMLLDAVLHCPAPMAGQVHCRAAQAMVKTLGVAILVPLHSQHLRLVTLSFHPSYTIILRQVNANKILKAPIFCLSSSS